MIKKTFYNLPKEKRERIINAVKDEFSKHPKEKVSINKIVKSANISRGSFYQYFDDKVDLVELLTGEMAEQITAFVKDSLIKNDGNIFITYKEIFDEIIFLIKEKDDCHFFKNILFNLEANSDIIFDFLHYRLPAIELDKKLGDFINTYINPKYLNCKTQEEVSYIFNILILVLKNSIFNIFVKQNDEAKEREIFLTKLDLLKNGLASNID